MNRLSTDARSRVLACLCEGVSQRATVRLTGTAKGTVARLAVELGEACERFADRVMVNLPCERIQCDEIWSFVGCKERQKKTAKGQHPGDVWTWVAIDPETKLIPRWYVGDLTWAECLPQWPPVCRRIQAAAREMEWAPVGLPAPRCGLLLRRVRP